MLALARNGYTAADVKKALHAETRIMRFRYELYDKNSKFKQNLTTVLKDGGRVEYNALSQIKRTANVKIRDDGTVNFLSDRIKPFAVLTMPNGGEVEFPLGVFVLSTPPRKPDDTGTIVREVQCYDLLQVVSDDGFTDRYTIAAGTNYITAIRSTLNGAGFTDSQLNLTPTTKTLPTAREWEPGTKKLRVINDLLDSINYRSLWFDENGLAIAEPYVSPADQAAEYTYKDDSQSVMFPQPTQNIDLFQIPNQWLLVVSNPDRSVLRSVYTNTNPGSPTSTVSVGRTKLAETITVDAADQASLDAMAARTAFEASQKYESFEFDTAVMPIHSDSDTYNVEFSDLGIVAKYSETSWSMELDAGGKMSHHARRIVTV